MVLVKYSLNNSCLQRLAAICCSACSARQRFLESPGKRSFQSWKTLELGLCKSWDTFECLYEPCWRHDLFHGLLWCHWLLYRTRTGSRCAVEFCWDRQCASAFSWSQTEHHLKAVFGTVSCTFFCVFLLLFILLSELLMIIKYWCVLERFSLQTLCDNDLSSVQIGWPWHHLLTTVFV